MRRELRGLLFGIALGVGASAVFAPAALAKSPPAPTLVTPDGPATLSSVWRGPSTAEARPPEVLQAVKITVGPGSAAGVVRLRVSDGSGGNRGAAIGDWFTLPAEPGTYTFPAPKITMDYRSIVLALDQQTGRHAIVEQIVCRAELGRWGDPCELTSLDVWRPFLPDGAAAVPPIAGGAGTPPTEQRPGQQLAIDHVSEIDRDGDLSGDDTEDRTDLAVRADAVRGRDGRMTITVTNNGPRAADWPRLTIDRPAGIAWNAPARGWTPECAISRTRTYMSLPAGGGTYCDLPPIAANGSHVVSLPTIDDGRPVTVTVAAEGPDLANADNTVAVTPRLAPAPTARLTVAASSRATRGASVRVRSDQAATAKVTLSVRYRGKLRKATRTVRLRAGAARTVTVRPVRVRGLFPVGKARLTVTIAAPGSETRTISRSVRLVR